MGLYIDSDPPPAFIGLRLFKHLTLTVENIEGEAPI